MKDVRIWKALTGIVIVVIVAREIPRLLRGSPPPAVTSPEAKTPAAKPKEADPGPLPAALAQLEKDMKIEQRLSDLTPAQRRAVLQVMADRPCDCGCPHGSTGRCYVDDPDCPRAPAVLKQAIELARGGKTATEMTDLLKPAADRPKPVEQASPMRIEVPPWAPIKGPRYAKVTIVDFSDFECAFCAQVAPAIDRLGGQYGNDIRVAFRHYPLPSHPHAQEAAEAAMSAEAQGKFWLMHDQLFAHQDKLDHDSIRSYAKSIGLDMKKFDADLASHRFASYIQKDIAAADTTTARATPILFFNGRIVVGAQRIENLARLIEEERKKADELLKKGVPLEKLYETIIADLPPPPAGK